MFIFISNESRNTGYTQEATKVQVDSVPSVSLHDNLDVTAADQVPTKVDKRTKPVKVVKEKQPAGEYRSWSGSGFALVEIIYLCGTLK